MTSRIAKLIVASENHADHLSWEQYTKDLDSNKQKENQQPVANITIAGPCQIGKSIIMDHTVKMLKAEFPGIEIEMTDPEEYDQLEDWEREMILKTKWITSEVTVAEMEKPSVSQEGIFSFFKKKNNKQDKSSPEIPFMEWFDKFKKDLSSIELTTETVTIPVNLSGAFYRNGKVITNPIVEFKTDVVEYRNIYRRYSPVMTKNNAWIEDINSQFKRFLQKYPGNQHTEEFRKLIDKIAKEDPGSVVSKFKEPTHNFLGYKNTPFTETDIGVIFSGSVKLDKTPIAKMNPLSTDTLKQTILLLDDLFSFMSEVSNYEQELSIGLDVTDPPMRGYGDTIEEIFGEDPEMISPFLSPTYDERNSDLFLQLVQRCSHLYDALGTYLQKSVR